MRVQGTASSPPSTTTSIVEASIGGVKARTAGKSSSSPKWSPDGQWIAFRADRGEDTQVYLIRSAGGEARPLTAVEDGVGGFEWSPVGKSMAILITESRDERREKIEETYGDFAVEDGELRMRHLWVLDVEAALATEDGADLPEEEGEDEDGDEEKDEDEDDEVGEEEEDEPPAFRRLTEGDDYTVGSFRWSPDGERIAFSHTPDTRVESFSHADLSIVDVASGEVRTVVERPGFDRNPRWSPDGKWLAFQTANEKLAYYFNSEIAKVPAAGGEPVLLSADFDEDTSLVTWLEDGVYFIALEGTERRLYRLGADGGPAEAVLEEPRRIWSVDFSRDGRTMAIDGGGPDRLDEIWRRGPDGSMERLTDTTGETADWAVGSRELVRWPSQDGVSIEGVLLKPEDFDPSVKHPLLVIIHGGPAWLSFPQRVYGYVYPVQQWLAKGAVILMPNYRGSAGYGEDFRALNVRNLGVGDAWDVISGVDHLIEQGFVDPERVGAMGWSQGGYISAFLTTSSDRFKAISVGAGISNWMTYYVNTDIHPFTRHYLEATPWDDPEIYAKTSPMTYVSSRRRRRP